MFFCNSNFVQDAEVQPSLVIVYFGGNDAVHPHPSGLGVHVPLPEYIDNMKKIYFHLKVSQCFFHLLFFVEMYSLWVTGLYQMYELITGCSNGFVVQYDLQELS